MKCVSVIVPSYNHAPYLKERMESILNQTYPEIEVLVLDDCSTDDSREVLEAYRNHPRVRLMDFATQNSGNTFHQWRRGIALAQGDYVWIAESDDVAAPDFLATLVTELERSDESGVRPVLAFSASQKIDAQSRPLPLYLSGCWKRPFRMDGSTFASRFLLGYNYICNASAVVMRREAALRVSADCLQYRASGDRCFWLEMALQGAVAYVPTLLNQFRQHEAKVSVAAEKAGRNIIEDHRIYEQMRPYVPLSAMRRRLICGYHYQAIHREKLSPAGQQAAMEAWHSEPEFGVLAYLFYLFSRFMARL